MLENFHLQKFPSIMVISTINNNVGECCMHNVNTLHVHVGMPWQVLSLPAQLILEHILASAIYSCQ